MIHAKYRGHESEPWVPALLRLDSERLEISTHSGHALAVWSGRELEGLGFPILDRRWVLEDRRVPGGQLMVENDEDYEAIRAIARHLPGSRWRSVWQLAWAAETSGYLAWIIVAIALPGIILWALFS